MRSYHLPIVIAAVLAAPCANATLWDYTYEGHLAAGSILGGTTLTMPTAFTLHALFDDATANLAAPVGLAGFVAYAPKRATLSVGGVHYALKSWDGTSGIAVSIFDETTPFGNGHVASGIIQNVLADGAGIVGDWLYSTPEIFSGGKLEPFQMTRASFFGVGFGAGVCAVKCGVDPLPATLGGSPSSITLVNADYTYKAYPFVGGLLTPYRDFASLALAPEPGMLALFGLGAGLIAVGRRRK